MRGQKYGSTASQGAGVAQLYVHEKNPELPRPDKELKGFRRIFLQPGEKQRVSIPLDAGAFAYYDPTKKSFVAQKDHYKILVGGSSRDIHLAANFTLPETIVLRSGRLAEQPEETGYK